MLSLYQNVNFSGGDKSEVEVNVSSAPFIYGRNNLKQTHNTQWLTRCPVVITCHGVISHAASYHLLPLGEW